MKIESYSFGNMKIDGKTYSNDLMIVDNEIRPDWYRDKGHSLASDDLKWIIEKAPEVLIVGSGKSGLMKVPQRTRDYLEQKGINYTIERTDQAVEVYNERLDSESRKEKVAGAFHLTC
ncbi:MAG: Mth938-like domain-containing protein [Candidatus Bipolaricaulota bacterium]